MDDCTSKFTPPAVDHAEQIPSVITGCPNLLQLTATFFFIPSFLCVLSLRPVGVAVYGANAVCSVYAHRPDRTSHDSWTDTLDLLMVAIWVIYNCVLVIQSHFKIPHVGIALCLAVCVVVTKVWTKTLEYRSKKRYAVHALMHLSGAIGSALLVI